MIATGLVAIAAKSALLLALAGFLARALRHSSAAARHLAWSAGLAAALLLPMVSLVMPAWRVLPGAESLPGIDPVAAATALTVGRTVPIVWMAGALILLGQILLDQMVLVRWRRRARPVESAEWQRAIERSLVGIQLARPITFLECDWIEVPCTWGTFRPTILLPSGGTAWTPVRRDCALEHELAHVRRFDPAAHLIARLACAAHWYNPAVWIAARIAATAREQACDDAVLARTHVVSEYASLLLELNSSASRQGARLHAALGLLRHSPIRARLYSILDERRHRAPARRRATMAATIAWAGIVLPVAMLAPELRMKEAQRSFFGRAQVTSALQTVCERGPAGMVSTVVLNGTKRGSEDQPVRFEVRCAPQDQ